MVAALCAGLYPQICSVVHPPKKFVDTIGGSLEKTAIIKDLRYAAYFEICRHMANLACPRIFLFFIRFYLNKAAVTGGLPVPDATTGSSSLSPSTTTDAAGESDSDDPEDSLMLDGAAPAPSAAAATVTSTAGESVSGAGGGILADMTRVFLAHSAAAAAPAPGHAYCGQPARLLSSR